MLKFSSIPKEADIVVAGGGTTGLLVASRLAKADPNLSIVVLEHGVNTRDDLSVINPAAYLSHVAPGSTKATFYVSKPSPALAGREAVVPIGQCLGGGSSINFMVYSRPQKIDFDDWNTEGWSGKDMIPFLKKFENFQDLDPTIDTSTHGYSGEFAVGPGTNAQTQFQQDFFNAAAQTRIHTTRDVSDLKTSDAIGKWNAWIDQKTGLRQDVPHRVLFPLLDEGTTSLQVATETKVIKILFDESKRASGVEYQSTDGSTAPKTIAARKLVVLAGGALGSPQILERSGVGSRKILSDLDIPVVSDLPGVGTNYQDHNVVFYPYRSSSTKDGSLDGFLSGRLSLEEALIQKKRSPTRYILGWNGADCVGKLRPSEIEVQSFSPSLRQAWEKDFKERPERPLMLISTIAVYPGDHSVIEPGQHFICGPYTPYPYSRGSIHITSKSPSDIPYFDCGYLSNPVDVEKLVWGYKVQRDIVRRMAHYRGPLKNVAAHPVFPAGSKADYDYVDKESAAKGYPVPITYTEDDNNTIRAFIRKSVNTTWHSIGTCAMKSRDSGGVVDPDLNVYGVKGLKIIDLSICPSNVAANTYATALAVGEKAASIIAKYLDIPYSVKRPSNGSSLSTETGDLRIKSNI
ncbi:hypothetical protein B7463_g8018, partial [Scytalidium lignicola]